MRRSAIVLRHLANAVARQEHLDEALGYLQEASELWKSLSDNSDAIHLHLAYARCSRRAASR